MPTITLRRNLDARTNLLCFLLVVTAIILAHSPIAFLVVTLLLFGVRQGYHIPFRLFFHPFRTMGSFFLLVWVMNAFFSSDDTPLWNWWIFHLTKAGIIQGLVVITKVALVLLAGVLFTALSSTRESITAIQWILTPLALFRIPVDDISLILGTSLQFIPMIQEETEKIKKAQQARGAVFGGGNVIKRAHSMLPLLLPVFLSAFSHADALATAMEARGYQSGNHRTPQRFPPFSHRDLLTLGGGILLVLFCRWV